MKKLLAGTVIGIVLMAPVGVSAWNRHQIATPIVGADCKPSDTETPDGEGYVLDKNRNRVPNYDDQRCSVTIYRFTDQGHTCYVSKGTNSGGLYCL